MCRAHCPGAGRSSGDAGGGAARDARAAELVWLRGGGNVDARGPATAGEAVPRRAGLRAGRNYFLITSPHTHQQGIFIA